MSKTARIRSRRRFSWLVVLCYALLTGCTSKDSAESQVRALIAAAERAAEERDVDALMDLIATDYTDNEGRTRKDLARYVRGFFIAHQSIHILTRVEDLRIIAPDIAEVKLVVAMVGREADSANRWDLATDMEELALALRYETGGWKISHVRRAPRDR